MPSSLDRRAELARRYTARLVALVDHGCTLPDATPGRVWYRYVVAVPNADALIAQVAAAGVTVTRPVENWGGSTAALTPVASRAFQHLVSLPLYPTLTDAEHDRVCAALIETMALSRAA